MGKQLLINELFDKNIFSIIAGPCAIENEDYLYQTAEFLSKKNIRYIRGGAFKLRTSPNTFQGLGELGVKLLHQAANDFNLISISEITSIQEIELMNEYIDVLLVGTRNMYNYPLLKALSFIKKPVILKRGMSATVKEWLSAAEYISADNNSIILCERGIRTFETCTRNTLDLASAVWVQQNTNYSVFIDPSHATGDAKLIIPMALASLASGCSGLMIEIHPRPEKALSDKEQMLDFDEFSQLLDKISQLKESI